MSTLRFLSAALVPVLFLLGCGQSQPTTVPSVSQAAEQVAEGAAETGCDGDGNESLRASGVFAYTVINRTPWILMGEEERDGEYLWADFVGGADSSERDAAVVAAREFWQETGHAYDQETTEAALQESEPVDVGNNVFIYTLKVPYRDADDLGAAEPVRCQEKVTYCWIPYADLTASIDAGRTEVPMSCGGRSTQIWDIVAGNLEEGKPLRQRLDSLLLP